VKSRFTIAERWDIGHVSERLCSWRHNAESLSLRPIVEIARDYQKNIGEYCDDHLRRWPDHGPLVQRWRDNLRRFLFWALAYEIALHFRRDNAPRPSGRAHTSFEMMDYRLTPQQFECALAEMKVRRRSVPEYAAFAAMQGLIRLHVTSPFGWAVRHQGTFRTLLGLK